MSTPPDPSNLPGPSGRTNPGDVAPQPLALSIDALTDRLVQAERELRDLSAGLAHADRLASLGTLAAMIAHEVNNLMTPVVAYAQLALSTPHDQELRNKALRRAEDHARKASEISEAILRFARPDGQPSTAAVGAGTTVGGRSGGGPGGGQAAVRRSVAGIGGLGVEGGDEDSAQVGAALDGALGCLARELAKDGIALTREIGPNLVRMRPVALQQVLLNLILNARRAMLRTGGSLTVRSRVARAEDCSTWNIDAPNRGVLGYVFVEVLDTGEGIAAGRAEQMFGPFVRGGAGGCVSSGGGGVGLGLAVCKRLVEDVGGRVWMESSPGRGTAVRFVVPSAGGEGEVVGDVERAA